MPVSQTGLKQGLQANVVELRVRVRLGDHEIIEVALGLPRCIRVLVHAYSPRPRDQVRHAYLRAATVLRPDRSL